MRRRADQHAVVVVGEALDLHQRLAAAVRARAEIRVLDSLAVERPDDVLGARGLEMLCPPAEVGDLLWMAGREVRGAAHMTGIRGTAGIAAPERVGDAAVVDSSRVAAFTRRQELPVPAGGRHPHFEPDVGVAGRLDRPRDAARGGIDRRRWTRRIEGTGGNHRGDGDRRIRQDQACETFTRRRSGLRRRPERPREREAQDRDLQLHGGLLARDCRPLTTMCCRPEDNRRVIAGESASAHCAARYPCTPRRRMVWNLALVAP